MSPLEDSYNECESGNGHEPVVEPVAIIGMGCRWPGGVRDAPGLWELLQNKRSGYREFGDHRFPIDGFYHPDTDRPGTISTRGGFVLEEDPRLFDPSFFGIQPLEVETMDASQRKLLEVIYESFENAGETLESISGSRTGVFVGNFATDHTVMQSRDSDHPRPYVTTGSSLSLLSNRISYIFNLTGPSVTLDTACSSSMYAIHLAANAMRNGDCDSAIVAASNWVIDPTMQIMMNKLGALSSTSACHTFDAAADGYARGEGFAALYLTKTQTAVDGGFPIRALIRGTAVNANGRTGGITHPSKAGQEAVIRLAYQNAGNLPLSDTTYFECHGTGTPVGDPVEISAIGNVFSSVKSSEHPLYVGSIKTNLGHTESASAIAGIMKAVLAIEAGVIPPSIGVNTLNPDIDFEKANVKVLTEVTPWPAGHLRRASINSFGYGGANGHCIIDHVTNYLPHYIKPGIVKGRMPANGHASNGHGASLNGNRHSDLATHEKSVPSHSPITKKLRTTNKVDADIRQLTLLPVSAHNESSLKLNVAALASVFNKHSLADIAYTLGAKRTTFSQRSFRIIDKDNAVQGMHLDQRVYSSPADPARLGFIFTGQGAQWHAMGRELFEYRVFRDAILFMDYVVALVKVDTPASNSWTIGDVLAGSCDEHVINRPEVSQTVCTAVQIGMVDLLASWSIRPTSVVGHSSGEMAAAYAAGRITAAESITAAYFRGQAVSKNSKKGAMLAVGLNLDEALGYIEREGQEEFIKVAAINSPASLTLSGETDAVTQLSVLLEKDGVFNRLLKTGGNAYHSHHMTPLGSDYSDILSIGLTQIRELGLCNLNLRYPRIAWVSSVTPAKSPLGVGLETGPSYWRSNLEQPVRFSEAVTNLIALKDTEGRTIDVLVEIGPHPALKGPINQTLTSIGKTATQYTHSLKRGEDGRASLLQLAGKLFGLNHPVDLAMVNSIDDEDGSGHVLVQGCTAIDLPPYQYAYGPVSYHESRFSKEYRSRKVARHDLIGSKLPGNAKLRPQWRNILRLKTLSWLGDHRLLPHAVFPAAGYIAMAVEASSRAYYELVDAHQVTGFSLRNVSINSTLRIPEDDYGVEVLLTMELVDAATADSPAWTSFSISSVVRDTTIWTEHCTGLVKVHISPIPERRVKAMDTDEMDARTVDSRPWYSKFAGIGLGYGPTFQGLSEICADPAKNLITAKLALKTTTGTVKGGESSYPLHPASLDALFQLGLIACHGGQVDKAGSAFVPIKISQLYLRSGNNEDWGTAVASGELRGLRGAYAKLQLLDQSANVVLDIPSLRCISYSGDSQPSEGLHQQDPFSSPFTRLEWKPDIRAMTGRKVMELFPPPQENTDRAPLFDSIHTIATLIVIDIYERFASKNDLSTGMSDQIYYFLAWIRRRVEQEDAEAMARAKQLSVHERQQWLEKLYSETDHLVEVKIARRLHKNMADILYERRTGVEVLVEDGLLTALYESGLAMTGAYPQLFRVLDCLGHANPNQNILELGAGTGGATRVAMKALNDAGGSAIKRYSEYAFTDISPGFLISARESMAAFNDVSFSVVNIEEDPLEQGHGPVYDLVIASQCLHATPSIAKTLANCRKLLKPGGKLVLVENTQNAIGHGLVLGTLTGYWDGVSDGRVDSPFLDLASWNTALLEAGFSGTELVLQDYPSPHNTASTIVSTLLDSNSAAAESTGTSQVVHLLHGASGIPYVLGKLAEELKCRGIPSKTLSLDNAIKQLKPGSRIIAFLDGENLLIEADAFRLAIFQHLARCASTMVWVTSCGIVRGHNPDGALAAGLLRTIGTENPVARFLFIDIDPEGLAPGKKGGQGEVEANLVRCIVDKEVDLQSRSNDEMEDREFVWQNGCLWVSRIVPDKKLADQCDLIKMPADRAELHPLDSRGPVRAAFQTPGILTSLYFKPYTELWRPLQEEDIELKVVAIGLNWKDLGISAGRFDANNLSSEYSGVVTRIGTAVRGFSVGDHVYGMGRGHFGNYTRVPAKLAQKLGPNDDLVEAATMPLVYMTAVYAFDHVTQLKAGEKVLIQSATGGLGLAAIQLAQSRGAEVFATVGNADKARFLTETTNIPSSHIFGSREVSEVPRAVAATGGRGFDVILSASKGDMLYESLKALHPLGRLIDVGRMDVLDAKAMSLELFQRSITFSSFDLGLVLDTDPDLGARLMEAVHRYHLNGDIGPVRPFTASDVSLLDQVLLGFSKGTHVGKLVVTFLDPEAPVRMVPAVSAARYDEEATYVITGGWGGLGRAIVRWMADRGARHVAVLSRSGASSPAAQTLIKDLAARGITITPVLCDVSVKKNVLDTFKNLSSKGQIKGLIHAAMSLQDLSFDKLSIEQWHKSLAAKVVGTKNLHEATAAQPLDFFVMITSLESVLALATQSAYTAANNFQEAFARYRRSRGLPASTASFGLISDVGVLGSNVTTVNMMVRNKVLAVTEHQFLGLLEPAFLESNSSHSTFTGIDQMQHDPLSAAGFITCLDPAAMAARKREEAAAGIASGTSPRWYSDARVSLIMRAFDDAYRHADDAAAAAAGQKGDASRGGSSSIARLRDEFDEAIKSGPGERSSTEALVASAIVETVASMLSIEASGVSQAKCVAEYGVDSLIAAELRNWFNVAFRTNIPLLDLLDTHTSIKALAGIVVDTALTKT